MFNSFCFHLLVQVFEVLHLKEFHLQLQLLFQHPYLVFFCLPFADKLLNLFSNKFINCYGYFVLIVKQNST
ncbi:hypothetical protein DMB91_07275 [Campylobacter sp. MIT 97-5078]|nr:hypothetical protein LR59_11825 [Campylobacter sp. MIT 97-5078]KGI56819.1 hypothetical protein LR59_04885 [Campylobacter sp. MIT 97-5078]TQR25596.1 hypothetical protein DMB91_07275 [Campylobacter sp. MIT 97-5078]